MWLQFRRTQQCLEAWGKHSKSSSWLLQVCSFSNASFRKSKLAPLQERRMIDRFKLWAKGGDGGNGCSSLRRSRRDRHGRPDGGHGGRGGDVILECSRSVWDFSSLQHHINAKRGGHGASKNQIGSRGADKVVLVPVGTVIHLVEGDVPCASVSNSTARHPWELPGQLVYDDVSESAEQSLDGNTSCPTVMETQDIGSGFASCTTKVLGEAAGAKQTTRKSAFKSFPLSVPPDRKSFASRESPTCWKEEDQSEEDGHMHEVEWEAGMEEQELDKEWRESINCEELDEEWKESINCEELDEEWKESTGIEEWEEGMEEEDMDEQEEQIQYNVAELIEPGQQCVVARGGNGGIGSVSLGKAKNHILKKPRKERNKGIGIEESEDNEHSSPGLGLPGSEAVLVLELKSIADVGFVGMPNAGKSTLLGAISRAKPAVGHYAFTTLRPNLGNLNYDDFSFTVADIPGIIKGAHENRGLGHSFLRHIERTKVLAYVLDLAATLDGRKGLHPWEQLRDLIMELELYSEGLSNRPSLIVASKMDEEGAEAVLEELKWRIPGVSIFPVCAVLDEGIPELKAGLRTIVTGGELCSIKLDDIVLH